MWSWREESNLQPAVYKTAALPIELRQPACLELSTTRRIAQYQQARKYAVKEHLGTRQIPS